MQTSGQKIRVLIADDSAFMRKVLLSIFSADPQLEVVGEARDGREAVSLSASLKPDVIAMDIMMPHMDGLQATEIIMSTDPRPVVIVSSESRDGAEVTLRALGLGAIDFVAKPSAGVDLDMNTVREQLCRKLKMAAKVRVVRTAVRPQSAIAFAPSPGTSAISHQGSPEISPRRNADADQDRVPLQSAGGELSTPRCSISNSRFPVVVVAASTGGPSTLMQFVPAFPADFPGAVLLVQHMPATFTSQFSRQLAAAASIRVKEAEQGEMLHPATAYVCPGSHHLRVTPNGRVTLDNGPRIGGYRPCADLALETAAAFAGPMTIGVVLTGMGSDGSRGVQLVKAAGGHVIAQDEATAVIFGMPSEAIRSGAVDQVLGLTAICPAIEKRVRYVLGAAKVGAL